jgi:hypothetical protein
MLALEATMGLLEIKGLKELLVQREKKVAKVIQVKLEYKEDELVNNYVEHVTINECRVFKGLWVIKD